MFFKTSKKLVMMAMLIVILLAIGVTALVDRNRQVASNYRQTRIPTLFFHGWGSSYHAEQHMVSAIRRTHATNGVIRAEVSKTGKVTLVGRLPKKAVNPIVMVNYQNSREPNYRVTAKWVLNVLQRLQATYHFKEFNTVSHSAGNEAVLYYLADDAPNHPELPRLNREINLAAHFAGIRGYDAVKHNTVNAQGKPRHMIATYQALLKLRKTYPRQAAVLNIYGNIGDHSDGVVQNYSSKSLRYLVANRAASYQELEIKGKRAQHSKLHTNATVDHAIVKFLWQK
ncbi:alpha/beta hydrolase [Pediococcus siamensis]|uniref:alpha/beta hydrolase n=1 Tax=Pediococcus siamensis TaxID=381829 RepID=UPI0039A2AAAB